MALRFDETWMLATVLLWTRLGALFAFSPLVTAAKVPTVFVVLLTLVLAGTLTAALGARTAMPLNVPALALAILMEVAIGALLGVALQCAFAAFSLAGHVLDVQMGFGMGSIYDPVTQSNTPVLSTALSLFGVALFFAVDGHHALLRGVAYSVTAWPPGHVPRIGSALDVVRPFGALFTTGVLIAAPVLFALLLAEVALGVLSRVLPQMNVFFVGIPAKILLGLGALALLMPAIGPAMARSFAGVFEFWDAVLR
jgi:flagellar biosynthesis protein FliR